MCVVAGGRENAEAHRMFKAAGPPRGGGIVTCVIDSRGIITSARNLFLSVFSFTTVFLDFYLQLIFLHLSLRGRSGRRVGWNIRREQLD